MSNLKQKPLSYRALALILAVIMTLTTLPATVIALAFDGGEAEPDPLAPQNLQAEYNSVTDKIAITWDPYESEIQVDNLKVIIDTTENSVDPGDTEYSTDASAFIGGEHTIQVVAEIEGDEHNSNASVDLPYNLVSVGTVADVTVDNDLTIAEIVAQATTDIALTVDGLGTTVPATVTWSTEGTAYDKAQSGAQTFTVDGTVTLPENIVNRDSIDLKVSANVQVSAAVEASIDSDLDDSAPIVVKVGQELRLSIAASGTAPTYAWYKDGTLIADASSNIFTISTVSLTDAGEYNCVVTGKTGIPATSKTVTVTVEKNATNVDLSITPSKSEGQTRPGEITIEVIGIPEDAEGTVIIKEGSNELKKITLPSSDLSVRFKAYGPNNSYDFSVEYSGDDYKYLESFNSVNGYGFNKGEQDNISFSQLPPSSLTYDSDYSFTVQAEGSLTSLVTKYEYAIINEKDVDGVTTPRSVAAIDRNTGKLTLIAAGTFTITVKALSDDDYNESRIVESSTITVSQKDQSDFSFKFGVDTVVYFNNFSYTRELDKLGSGEGKITYTLGAHTAEGVDVNPDTGEITYLNAENDNSIQFSGTAGTVEVIATKAADKRNKERSTSYTITITKAEQSKFIFEDETPTNITYTENSGTTFTNVISSNKNENGWVNADNAPKYTIEDQKSLSGEAASDVVSIDEVNSTITAHRSGIVTIKATLVGNGVYNDVDAVYTITINRGEIEGFAFAKTSTADTTIKYGYEGYENIASGGQSDSTDEVTYVDDSDEVNVSANGIISFAKLPSAAANGTYTVIITATKPETDKYNEKSITYTLTVNRDQVVPATDFRVNGEVIKDAALLTSPNGWYNAEHNGITITPYGEYTQISENGTDWSKSITRSTDDNHTISFYLRKDNGEITLLSTQKVNYDKTFATAKLTVVDDGNFWTEFLETITFGLWKNESKKVLVEAEDNLSGIMTIEYYEQNDNFDQYNKDNIADADIAWVQCSLKADGLKAESTVDVELKQLSNKKVVVYAKVTDYAGNVSYFRTDGMIFDSITPDQKTELPDPIINIELPNSITEGLYNGEVPFKLTVNDQQTNSVASGIKTIKVTITGSGAEDYSKVINVATVNNKSEISKFDSSNINSNEFTVDNTFVIPANFDSNYLTILVEVEDYAGNKYTNRDSLTHLAIDVTNPEISVSYDDNDGTFSNGKYIGNDKNREATINITELNFVNNAVVITVIQDGKKLDIQPNFAPVAGAVDENGDQIGWQMKINYATLGEGEFDFDIEYTDKATNKNNAVDYGAFSNPQNFIIDNTKPVITVEISNSEVANDKYFADDRTATVTIVERNFSENYQFDWSGLTYTLDGVAQTAPVPRITKSDDGTYVRVYTIEFSAEGDYTFDVKYTDLADNVAETYSCDSVSYKEFTVDKTDPVITIDGVNDKTPYNSEVVAPIISYFDINSDSDVITLTVIENGSTTSKPTEYKEASADKDAHGDHSHGRKVELVNIKNDGIYTLTVTATDKAGRFDKKEFTFSVNRNGSIYDITSLTDNVIGKYLQHEQDVVFTETNVDLLKNETVILKLTKNGTPIDLVEGKDYDVEPIVDEWAVWSQYKYTVHNSLFVDDGMYSIAIYSEDAAGNKNENIDEKKAAEISFGIDKTKPVILPIDFESGVQYPIETKHVEVEIKDNLVLEGVKFYLNGNEVKYELNGDTYAFDIPEANIKQNVRIVAVDAAGNEHEVAVEDFLVSTNLFVRWYNNTPLFVGSIVGVLVIAIAAIAFILFGKKKKKDDK